MDLNISGSGQISAGEYDNIRISGSGHAQGMVRCNSFQVSGSANGNELVCVNDLHVSGSGNFSGNVTVGSMEISGSFGANNLVARERIGISGTGRSAKSVKCRALHVSGTIRATEDIEAETAAVRGIVDCEGLLNAEDLEIEYRESMHIGSIGGSKIRVYERPGRGRQRRFLFFKWKNRYGNVYVKNAIEGDEISLEGVVTPRVSGRVVKIGKNCDIELVQYSESVDIAPEAKVGQTERI